jgi:hypothetical protein
MICKAYARQLDTEAMLAATSRSAPSEPLASSSISFQPAYDTQSLFGDIEMLYDPDGEHFGNYRDLDVDLGSENKTDVDNMEVDMPYPVSSSPPSLIIDNDSDSDEEENDLFEYTNAEDENGWEPDVPMAQKIRLPLPPDNLNSDPPVTIILPHSTAVSSNDPPPSFLADRPPADPSLAGFAPHIEQYPHPRAGKSVDASTLHSSDNQEYAKKLNGKGNIWAPFKSELDWRLARWAKKRGPGSNSFTELLDIPGVSC